MNKIEKSTENNTFIKELYDNNRVVFENATLKSEQYCYYISYFAKKDIYDVLIEDNNGNVINYEARKKLSGSTLKYFRILKDEIIKDNFGNQFICISHSIEFE